MEVVPRKRLSAEIVIHWPSRVWGIANFRKYFDQRQWEVAALDWPSNSFSQGKINGFQGRIAPFPFFIFFNLK
ncbi:MAG: hypothetical protein LBI77_00210 [Puniceicoccales bacterium]|jgi:hypothetical protein|nr:hypothetical protein [Puniceicoccales bacterium]